MGYNVSIRLVVSLSALLEAMSPEPANGDTRLARSGLGQTQIIGKLIGRSEEGKMWEFRSLIQEFGSSEKSKRQITNFKAHNL